MLFFKLTLFEHIRDGTQKKTVFHIFLLRAEIMLLFVRFCFEKTRQKILFFKKALEASQIF